MFFVPDTVQCVIANNNQCLHRIHDCVSLWQEHTTLTQSRNVLRFLRSEPGPGGDIIFGIADLVQVDSTVAIAAQDEPILDFYLLYVTSKLDLTTYSSADYGSEFPPYNIIFTGHFIESVRCYVHSGGVQTSYGAVSTIW